MKKAVLIRILLVTGIISMISCASEGMGETEQFDLVNNTNLEVEVMTLVNSHRESIDLVTLNFNEVAYSNAEDHTDYMISKGRLSHDNFSMRVQKISSETNAEGIGENVAKDYLTAKTVFEGWMNSPPHKATIEGDFTHTAISVKENANGTLYYTQIFFK